MSSFLRTTFPRVILHGVSASVTTLRSTPVNAARRAFTSIHPAARPTLPSIQSQFTGRRFASGGAAPKKDGFPIIPLVAIFLGGSGLFYLLVKQREGNIPESLRSKERDMSTENDRKLIASGPRTKPTFDPNDVTVIFVLGGPGAGKGTQCANIVRGYGFAHYSAGDLLRIEQARPDSEFGELIKTYIREGKIVPMEVTVALLENAMRDEIKKTGTKRFLIDGFPRQMDQALKFEQDVCPSKLVLFFDTTEEVMLKRLLRRAETSGREDDNIESIRKRFRTFVEASMPVVEYYEKLGKVVKVDASNSVDEVFEEVKKRLDERLKLKN
ncbi:UMP-CMP kinase [Terfezia claveryi]|nr:UMP-CMP kinase [Terfezia claveryi]